MCELKRKSKKFRTKKRDERKCKGLFYRGLNYLPTIILFRPDNSSVRGMLHFLPDDTETDKDLVEFDNKINLMDAKSTAKTSA